MQGRLHIVILDGCCANPGDLSWQPLEELGELIVYDRTAPEQVIERARGAEIVLTNKVILGEAQFALLPDVRYVGVLATGYNVVDIEAAHRRGITVTYVPAYSTDSVAQSVFAHLLNVANKVEYYTHENRKGRWCQQPVFCYWDTPLIELYDKTIGVIGLGNIGMKVASIAHAFGMKVVAYTSKNVSDIPSYVEKVTFENLLSGADIVTLHCPLTDKTNGMIDRESLSKMKKGAILINTGRGPLVDEQAVSDALDKGQLSAFCADVLSMEPPSPDNPLLHNDKAFITPHIAWATREARSRLVDVVIDNVRAFVEGRPQNVV